jgi:hypothetical protein
MNAANVAKKLAALGFTSTKVEEAGEEYDGTVQLSPKVHVQVGPQLCVVAENSAGTEFKFFDPRTSRQMDLLVADIKAAEAFDFGEPAVTVYPSPGA